MRLSWGLKSPKRHFFGFSGPAADPFTHPSRMQENNPVTETRARRIKKPRRGVRVKNDENNQPAVVAANAPHADAGDGLRVEHAAVHGVDQVQQVVLQQQVHVLALHQRTKHLAHSLPPDVGTKHVRDSFQEALDFMKIVAL